MEDPRRLPPPIALLVVALALPACGRASGARVEPAAVVDASPSSSPARASAAPSAPAVAPRASSSSSPEPAPKAATALPFAAAVGELSHRCDPKQPAATNLELKEQAAAANRCREEAMNRELDRVLVPWKSRGAPQYRALMSEQAAFNRYRAAACWVTEEASWVDFAAGTRDDGSMRSMRFVSCQDQMLTERYYFGRARDAGAPEALARRISESHDRGTRAKQSLARMGEQAEQLLKQAIPAAGAPGEVPGVLSRAARVELATQLRAAQSAPPALARATCAGWPELATALGGEESCRSKAALYYFAHSSYGQDP